MRAELFKFHMTDFEEVYAIIDDENKRLHISLLNYSYSITFDLTEDLYEQVEQLTKFGEQSFNGNVRRVARKIIEELREEAKI